MAKRRTGAKYARQTSAFRRVEKPELGQAEEVHPSFEGETRCIWRTRPAGKAKERATEGKANMAKEDDFAAKERNERRKVSNSATRKMKRF